MMGGEYLGNKYIPAYFFFVKIILCIYVITMGGTETESPPQPVQVTEAPGNSFFIYTTAGNNDDPDDNTPTYLKICTDNANGGGYDGTKPSYFFTKTTDREDGATIFTIEKQDNSYILFTETRFHGGQNVDWFSLHHTIPEHGGARKKLDTLGPDDNIIITSAGDAVFKVFLPEENISLPNGNNPLYDYNQKLFSAALATRWWGAQDGPVGKTVDWYGEELLAARVFPFIASAATGDPYVSPLYGDAYKLPDRAGNYRYVSTFSPYNRRFTIDADVRMLRKDEQADMLRYILAHNKDRVAELQGRIVLDGYFFRNYLLTNCGDKLRVDMEANTINNGPLRNMSTDAFTVRMGRREAQSVAPYHKEKNKVLYSITITTHHEAYGEIEVTLFKYANPQIRNGISMRTSRKMTRENAKGLILGYQPSKNFSIHKLGSKKDIVAYGEEAQTASTAKKVMETFDYESSGKQAQIHFLQETTRA